ncbi:FeoB-associated Cys-rich membrane protein [Clostridium sp. AL.422]|uniref:FeoB-associated Cys-rich membrane protein n=1 Tax=Clostridium TaxID=1485 RepID=UPI00293DD722|nr:MULTISPECIES: FeoB-associated Cys-rich membrane protein [unclassified Clostridium]MDV4150482.1 FeoB-associated Cys-rich membrane protein [Clostridium sp. AL.422]
MEILITLVIVALAAYILFKTFHKSSKGSCSCGSCSDHCPMYKDNSNALKIKKYK